MSTACREMKEISRGGSLANTLGAINPFRYRGYVYDEETGLYYLRSRYYDPNIGRFISSDSILGQVGSLLQHNLFCYCGNEVIYLIDVDGYMESAIDGGGSFFGAPIFISIDHSIFRFDFNSSENYTGIYQPVTLDYFDNVDFDIIQEVCLADIASEVLVEYYSDSYSRKIAAKRVKCSSKKEAYERAKRAGNGKEPDFHNNNKKPHYHPHVGNSVFETTHDVSKHDHYFFPVRHSILFVYRWIEEAVERWQETRKSSRNS